jgi:hypothetical protein
VVALLGLAEAVFVPGTKVLLLSRSLRQSTELFRIVLGFYRQLGEPMRDGQTTAELTLENRSRIICLALPRGHDPRLLPRHPPGH